VLTGVLLGKLVAVEVTVVQTVKHLVRLWVESVQHLKSVPALKKTQAVAAVVVEVCFRQLTQLLGH
jgi:hypothetical protein